MKQLIIFFINLYQNHISSLISKRGIHCKFYPTCSEYAKEAVEKYGSIKGIFLALKRIIKCNPFSKGGYDPLK